MVSGLTLRPLIHFEFIFLYAVRKCSSYTFPCQMYSFFMLKICEKLSNDKTDGVLNVENPFNFLLPKRIPSVQFSSVQSLSRVQLFVTP